MNKRPQRVNQMWTLRFRGIITRPQWQRLKGVFMARIYIYIYFIWYIYIYDNITFVFLMWALHRRETREMSTTPCEKRILQKSAVHSWWRRNGLWTPRTNEGCSSSERPMVMCVHNFMPRKYVVQHDSCRQDGPVNNFKRLSRYGILFPFALHENVRE